MKTEVLQIPRFPSELKAALRKAASQRMVSMSDLVREAVAAHPDVAQQLGAAPTPPPAATDDTDLSWD